MIRKFLPFASLAAFLMVMPTQARLPYQDSQTGQQAPKVHSITGKVTQVESGGRAFSLDASLGRDNHPMRFVVDKNTVVQGHVAAGTTASVDYRPDANGQLKALAVKEE